MELSFGEFRMDSSGRQLLRAGRRVPLSRKACRLLGLLLGSRPAVVSKAELQERLWPGTFVVEANISNLVAEVRSALGDDPRRPRFIRTVHGVGYAFCCAVVEPRPPTPAVPPRDSFCWLISDSRRVQLGEGEHLIGRHPASVIPIDSPTVSRHHAAIRVAGEEAVLWDLGSRNGTYVGERRVEEPTALTDGDVIRLGSFAVAFRVASQMSRTAVDLAVPWPDREVRSPLQAADASGFGQPTGDGAVTEGSLQRRPGRQHGDRRPSGR